MHSEEQVIKMIGNCTDEQINNVRGMSITTEFSSSMLPTETVLKAIKESEAEMNEAGLPLKWRFYNCQVCKQHDVNFPIHYEIYNPKYDIALGI